MVVLDVDQLSHVHRLVEIATPVFLPQPRFDLSINTYTSISESPSPFHFRIKPYISSNNASPNFLRHFSFSFAAALFRGEISSYKLPLEPAFFTCAGLPVEEEVSFLGWNSSSSRNSFLYSLSKLGMNSLLYSCGCSYGYLCST